MKPVALITGATSGIGKAYAMRLAKEGYSLIITGRRETLLKETATFLSRAYGTKVTICTVDFAKPKAFKKFAKWVEKQPHINFLVNNAGFGAQKSFTRDTISNQLDLVKVHIDATVTLTHIVTQKMKKQRKGVIINVSSLASYIPLPTSAMYCSTKAFLVRFSECLHMELKPYGIKVQALCPGFVYTDFHKKLDISSHKLKNRGPIRWIKPQKVVHTSFKTLSRVHQVIVIPGRWNKVGYYLLNNIPKTPYYMTVGPLTKLFGDY